MRILPVTGAFDHAIRSTIDNIAFAFHVSWPWMLVLLPINIASDIYAFAHVSPNPEDIEPGVAVVTFLTVVAAGIAFASIAVNWHRYILLNEVPEGMARLRLDWTVWRYAGNFILVVLILMLVLLGAGLVMLLIYAIFALANTTVGAASLFLTVPAYLALLVATIPASYRLSVKLPGVALGRTDFKFRDAWYATQGNFWRLFGLFILLLLVGIVAAIVGGIAGFVFGKISGDIGLAVAVAIQLLVNWVGTILGVTVLTSLYGFFVEGRDF